MTAFLLKDRIADNNYATIAGLTLVAEELSPLGLDIVAKGIFTGAQAEQAARDRTLNNVPREYELSFETGTRLRGKFRITHMRYAGEFNVERRYEIGLASVGNVETVQ